MPKFVLLATDMVLLLLLLALAWYVRHAWRDANLRKTWRSVGRNTAAMCSAVLLLLFLVTAVLDSVHFRPLLPPAEGAAPNSPPAYATSTLSLLDWMLSGPREAREQSYSVPLGTHLFAKQTLQRDGKSVRDFPRLQFGGKHLSNPAQQWASDVAWLSARGIALGVMLSFLLCLMTVLVLARFAGTRLKTAWQRVASNQTELPWRPMLVTASVVLVLAGWVATLWPYYHVFGTDQTGNDILVQALKSIRTAVVIGAVATIATLPLAVTLGVLAGYFKGWVDALIQYIYTVLSSIPSVLLIAACVLLIHGFVDSHPDWFATGLERADIRLFLLATILGLTGWSALARLLRAETFKLAELDYVQAARAFGVSHAGIMRRHILPNVIHIVLIVSVLDFSGLVLLEAVLSYVGVGVDPATVSFGTMINSARSELARDPAIWWNLLTGFAFMVTLVLALQLFASGVQDAFDPRTHALRTQRETKPKPKTAPAPVPSTQAGDSA